jgi:hypothetical protein
MRKDVLEMIGVKPLERRRFRFSKVMLRDVGEVGMVLLGRKRVVPVVFSEEGDAVVIGVTALRYSGWR